MKIQLNQSALLGYRLIEKSRALSVTKNYASAADLMSPGEGMAGVKNAIAPILGMAGVKTIISPTFGMAGVKTIITA